MPFRMGSKEIFKIEIQSESSFFMKKKDPCCSNPLDFKEQTPEALLKTEKKDPLYEKAFLSGEDPCKTEYARNTTTWE